MKKLHAVNVLLANYKVCHYGVTHKTGILQNFKYFLLFQFFSKFIV